ncbi:glyoxalase/bleomycin resistance/extradiol dioxygenase family protein [Spongiactinospora rosea]|uniref:Glyoxalase/bleomycin resistance/extradiol dioxygenase family protein n=1 Tax=Spongiactinospora rosea TaxID=2248750 RepID=A0A366M110_9ACTN|nr:glyoxalase/bleomycin resistance/extradiol dioxygenase family protein [Spongiactinospora rosea]RBQ19727.1 glyoxalase/bleomycin resistance/extradiol dioxygenase family protein [Spongiactinospora rosea]
MDALHPRLLVSRFADCHAFYDAILASFAGAKPAGGSPTGPYASWDVGGQCVLALIDRDMMADALPGPGPSAEQDTVMFVCRVPDVDAGLDLCLRHGGTLVARAADRPEWGENLRAAHLRDPAGTLIELQSY